MEEGRTADLLPGRTLLPAVPEPAFDRFAELTRRVLGVPTALVTLVDRDRQAFPGAVGLPEPWQTQRQTPLSHSFCQYVVADAAPLVIGDARQDPELKSNLAIDDLGVIAYAGMPLTNRSGDVVGSLCAIDSEPRDWTSAELANLQDLAAACSSELHLREVAALSHRQAEQTRSLIDSMPVGYLACDADGVVTEANVEAARIAGSRDGTLVGRLLWDLFPGSADSELGHAVQRVARTGAPHSVEAYLPAPLDAWYDIRAIGGRGRVSLFFADVSERHRAQTVLERAAEHDRTVAATLQQVLLTELPVVRGAQLAARYLTAESTDQVGGDWYDAVVQPSGALAVSVGDVCGHGIEAAASMGQLRAMLRGFIWDDDGTVAHSLSRLDAAARGHGEIALATLISGRVVGLGGADAPTFVYSNAGHPPPLLMLEDGTVSRVEAKAELMLGVDPRAARSDHSLELPPGSTLILYTDGLVERRTQRFDVGIDRLARVLSEHREGSLDELLDRTLLALREQTQADDIAVLAVRIDDASR